MTDELERRRDSEKEMAKSGSILAPAPVLFVPALLLGLVLDHVRDTKPQRRPWNVLLGGLLFLAGIALFAGSLLTMRSVGKSPSHEDTPPELITDGPFQYTRNPIYTSLVAIYIGTTLLIDGSWPLITVLPVLLYLDRVIDGEEAFLEVAFGEEFDRYRSDVPRWL